MEKQNCFVVIMAGGVGSRFWPFSRSKFPKQFQDILGTGKSFLQETADRFDDICPKENIYVVTNKQYYDLVKIQLPYLSDEQILLEPFRRNTAPCIAYAAYKIDKLNPNANIVVVPADHVILKPQVFAQNIKTALEFTQNSESVVTLGIKPSRPDTGYGYIQIKDKNTKEEVKLVQTFTEKPSLELAQSFLESGDFIWNAGIFIWNAKTIIKGFEKYQSLIAELFGEIQQYLYTPQEADAVRKAYSQCHPISIDNGIMEYARDIYVIACDFGWSDLGTWKSYYEIKEKNEDGNVLDGSVHTYDSTNCIVKVPKDQLVVLQGLDNYIVVQQGNALLICQKDKEQNIKQYLQRAIEEEGEDFA